MGFKDKFRNLQSKVADVMVLSKKGSKSRSKSSQMTMTRADLAMKRFNLTPKQYEELKKEAKKQLKNWHIAAPGGYLDEIMRSSQVKNADEVMEKSLKSSKSRKKRKKRKTTTTGTISSLTFEISDQTSIAEIEEKWRIIEEIAFGYYKDKTLLEFHVNQKFITIPEQLEQRKKLRQELKEAELKSGSSSRNVGKVLTKIRKDNNDSQKSWRSFKSKKSSSRSQSIPARKRVPFRLNTTDHEKTVFAPNWYTQAPGQVLMEKKRRRKKRTKFFWMGSENDRASRAVEEEELLRDYESVCEQDIINVQTNNAVVKKTGIEPPDSNQKLKELGIVWKEMQRTSQAEDVYAHTLDGCVKSLKMRKKKDVNKSGKSRKSAKNRRSSKSNYDIKWADEMDVVVFNGQAITRQEGWQKPHQRFQEKMTAVEMKERIGMMQLSRKKDIFFWKLFSRR